jgi:hypothetical protein
MRCAALSRSTEATFGKSFGAQIFDKNLATDLHGFPRIKTDNVLLDALLAAY